jgi:hypothetical protein
VLPLCEDMLSEVLAAGPSIDGVGGRVSASLVDQRLGSECCEPRSESLCQKDISSAYGLLAVR